MAEFANFLLQRKKADGQYHAPGAVTQYFSTFKAVAFKKFKPLGYAGAKPEWYSELYNGLAARATNGAIGRGEKVKKKAVGMPRKVLVECGRYLMKLSTAQSYEERAVIATLFSACGRSGEVAVSAWDNMTFDADKEVLCNYWGDLKNGTQYEMMYLNDAKDYPIDVPHAFACNLIIGGHGGHKASASPAEAGVHWMFPGYYDMADGGAASKVSRIIDKCREGGEVDGIPVDSTSFAWAQLKVGISSFVGHVIAQIFLHYPKLPSEIGSVQYNFRFVTCY